MESGSLFCILLAWERQRGYTIGMCKPFRDYLTLTREYTREIITFGGFALVCFVYGDFRQLARDQATTAAQTVEILRAMDIRLSAIEHQATPAAK